MESESEEEITSETFVSLGSYNIVFAPPGGMLTMERIRQLMCALPKFHDTFWKAIVHSPCCEGGVGFLLDHDKHYPDERGLIGRTPPGWEENTRLCQFRFYGTNIGMFVHDYCGLDYCQDSQEDYDHQWEIVPEELYRKRLQPSDHGKRLGFLTRDVWRNGNGESVLSEWDNFTWMNTNLNVSRTEIENFEKNNKGRFGMQYDLFTICNVGMSNLEMMLPLYRAMQHCGFTIVATKGFGIDGALDQESLKGGSWRTHISFQDFQATYHKYRKAILSTLGRNLEGEIQQIILDFAGCYGEHAPIEDADQIWKRGNKPRIGVTKRMICEAYEKDSDGGDPPQDWLDKHPEEWPRLRLVKRRKLRHPTIDYVSES